jgi:hypothetical protein
LKFLFPIIHLKADVATFLSYRQNNRKTNFNILMTHLKVDVANFCLTGRIIRKKNFNILKMLPHQPLNGSLKY